MAILVDQDRPTFDTLLARADDETLQYLVGPPAVRLLNAFDPTLARPSKLREICIQLHAPESLLREPEARRRLIELLLRDEAACLARLLGHGSENPHDSILRTRFRRGSHEETVLFGYLSVTGDDEGPPPERRGVESIAASYGLFGHQRSAQQDVLEILAGPDPRVVLHMPTGSGKTRTAMHVVCNRLRQQEPSVVVWLAYSEELCDQAAEEFETAWSHLGDRQLSLYRFWGSNRKLDICDVTDGLVIAGLAKTYERAKRDGDFISRLADRTCLVVIDEAHQAVAETYRFLLNYLVDRKSTTGLLGLTATPGRTWNNPSRDEELARFFRYNKVALEVPGYDNPVKYLISEGYLARFTVRPLPYTSDHEFTAEQLQTLATALDVPETMLRALGEDEKRNLAIVKEIEHMVHRHSRILVFAATVDHAILLATVLQARGIEGAVITGQTPEAERSRIIANYKSSDPVPRVLCNFGVLTAGFDAPKTSAAVIARPTTSLVLYSQMIGRATRGPLVDGNSDTEIVSVVMALVWM